MLICIFWQPLFPFFEIVLEIKHYGFLEFFYLQVDHPCFDRLSYFAKAP